MSNPFDKNYKAQIDMTDAVRDAQISAKRSAQRQQQLASRDEAVRKQALGDLGAMSKRKRKVSFK